MNAALADHNRRVANLAELTGLPADDKTLISLAGEVEQAEFYLKKVIAEAQKVLDDLTGNEPKDMAMGLYYGNRGGASGTMTSDAESIRAIVSRARSAVRTLRQVTKTQAGE